MKKSTKTDIVTAANINNLRVYTQEIDQALQNAKDDIIDQAQRYSNNTLASQAGFVAESVHVGSFNVDSAIKRSSLKAVKEKNGFHGDYKVLKGSKVIAKGEFKHYNTPKQTENAMRGYDGRDLVGPSDQIEEIKKIAKTKAMKNKTTRPQVSKEHQEVHKKATNAIKKENVSSKPKTLKEIKKITKKAARKKVVQNQEILPDLTTSLKSSALSGALDGAKTGAVFGGSISTISNIKDVYDGKKSKSDALIDISKDITLNAIDSAVKNAAGSAAKTASLHIADKVASQTAKRVLGSAAPIVVATTAVEIGKDVYKYANGEIDGETLGKNAAKCTATSAGAWAGAETGAVVGAMVGGPVGAAIGGVIGGIGAAIGIGALFD